MSNKFYHNDVENTIKIYSTRELGLKEKINLNLKEEFAIIWNTNAPLKIKINNKDFELEEDSISLVNDLTKIKLEPISEIRILKIKKDFLYLGKPKKNISYYSMLFYSNTYLTTYQLSKDKIEDKHFKRTWELLVYFTKNIENSNNIIILNLLDYILLSSFNKIEDEYNGNFKNEFEIETLRKFHILVEQNFKQITDVKSYANLLNVTPKTLYNISKRNNIAPPSQKIKRRRLILIKQLLETTEKSLKEIAEDLSFSDIHSLSRFFKIETKISPSAYRKLVQKGKIDKF